MEQNNKSGDRAEKNASGKSPTSANRRCFIIAPIGEPGSEIRRRSDQVFKYIFEPIVDDVCRYEMRRADKISEPGLITSQIIDCLLQDELVIADLTGWNPNVFYELAIRHAARKPVIQLIHLGERIPFDVAQSRTIVFDFRDLDSVAYCKEELEKQIRAIEQDPTKADNPVTFTIDLGHARESQNPVAQSNAEVMQQLLALGSQMRSLSAELDGLRRYIQLVEPPRSLGFALSDPLANEVLRMGSQYLGTMGMPSSASGTTMAGPSGSGVSMTVPSAPRVIRRLGKPLSKPAQNPEPPADKSKSNPQNSDEEEKNK